MTGSRPRVRGRVAMGHTAIAADCRHQAQAAPGTAVVGVEPDVVAFDGHAGRLYVAAESGSVTVLQLRGSRLHVIYSGYLGDDAHVVAVDPASGRSYFPVLSASSGHPAVLVCAIN